MDAMIHTVAAATVVIFYVGCFGVHILTAQDVDLAAAMAVFVLTEYDDIE